MKGGSDVELSGQELEDGQIVKQDFESSEEDKSAFKEREQGQGDDTHCPLWLRQLEL